MVGARALGLRRRTSARGVNAGLPDRKGHVRPFPKFEIMLQIAAVLEVDLGYLIGDIECKTYKAQDAP